MTLFQKLAVLALLCSTAAVAQDAGTVATPPPPTPTAEEIKKVVDYYMNGINGGPILIELKACSKVDTDKASATLNDCKEPVVGKVKKGSISAWMLWFVPKGAKYDDVTVQILHEGQVRETKDIPLMDSMRSRTWKSANLSKPGKWTFKIMRGANEVKSVDVTVE